MANTITKSGNTVEVLFVDAALDLADTLGMDPTGVKISGMTFYPNAANDTVIVRDGSVSGPIIWKFTDVSATGGQILFPGGKHCSPHVAVGEIVAGAILTFDLM